MTLKTRLIISLAVLSTIILALIGTGFMTLGVINQQTANLLSAHITPMRDLKIAVDAYAVAIVDNVHKTRAGTVSWEKAGEVLATARADIDAAWARLQARTLEDYEVPLVEAIVTTKQFADSEISVLDEIFARHDAAGLEAFATQRLYPAIDPVSSAVGTYVDDMVGMAALDMEEQGVLQANMRLGMIVAALVALGAIGYCGYVILRSVAFRLEGTAAALSAVAGGDFAQAIPYVGRKDEIGRMASAAEVFRLNGLKLLELTESEKAQQIRRETDRRAMMAQLQKAFGSVIAAARAGDLDRRVDVRFDDPELTALAEEVNLLLDTVSGGLSASAEVLSALARAELDRRVEGHFEGAFGKLQADTNAVADRLTAIVGDLRSTSGDLRSATGEILSGSADLAERTTRQAATIEQTSATMSHFAASISATANEAEQAAREVERAASNASASGASMQEAREAMERISASSQRIFNIIGMIDDIAFQTNLLALNASVEAARAGDAGSGFAVVAQEVRRLAQSAAESSAEVKGLVEQSAREVSTGRQMVATAASNLDSVLSAVEQSAQSMLAISRASQEQAREIAEVSTAVRQLDEMTQHNAALVEETNAAIGQTERQAVRLEALIDVFQVQGRTRTRNRLAA